MDILHKVNLHIFVEFQNYIAHSYGEYFYGKSIYDYTQETISECLNPDQLNASNAWVHFKQGWFAGHSKPNEGHGKPCYYCQEPTDSFAGNPGMWPVALCHPDDPGRTKWHHSGCVSERLHKE